MHINVVTSSHCLLDSTSDPDQSNTYPSFSGSEIHLKDIHPHNTWTNTQSHALSLKKAWFFKITNKCKNVFGCASWIADLSVTMNTAFCIFVKYKKSLLSWPFVFIVIRYDSRHCHIDLSRAVIRFVKPM